MDLKQILEEMMQLRASDLHLKVGTPPTIQDLGSTNGIVVDGQHTTRANLRDGSRIVVGSTTIVYRQAEG